MNVLELGFNYEILAIRELGTRADYSVLGKYHVLKIQEVEQ